MGSMVSASGPMECPGAAAATVLDAKLGYLTNPDPGLSGGKGYLFNSIGYGASNAADLRDVFVFGLQGAAATGVGANGGGGTNYVVRMDVTGPRGSLDLRTVWAANPDGTHLVTAYPWRDRRP
jgi:hypothetical protein